MLIDAFALSEKFPERKLTGGGLAGGASIVSKLSSKQFDELGIFLGLKRGQERYSKVAAVAGGHSLASKIFDFAKTAAGVALGVAPDEVERRRGGEARPIAAKLAGALLSDSGEGNEDE